MSAKIPPPADSHSQSDATLEYLSAGLPAPPIPPVLAPSLRRVRSWLYSTRPDSEQPDGAPGPYDLAWYGKEFLDGRAPAPYLVTGHDGHGINSWALHWYLVQAPLAIFVQTPWGNAYDDETQRSQAPLALGVLFAGVQSLMDAAPAARESGRLAPGDWLVVVASDLSGHRWAPWPAGDRRIDWREPPTAPLALEAALDWMQTTTP